MKYTNYSLAAWMAVAMTCLSCGAKHFDVIVRNGMIYDGNGGAAFPADIGINADTIAEIGNLSQAKAKVIVEANQKAVAPGFINMLSWAPVTLLLDGRSQSDLRQGVTLEVFGEGESMGPLNERMKQRDQNNQGDLNYTIAWNTLGEYLDHLEKKKISCNVASFVGATTLRDYVIGEENRPPTAQELDAMKDLVRQAMEEGALGVGSSLIYPPAFFASTAELIELCKVAGAFGGNYISHLRSEGNNFEQAVDELITIAREAHLPAEIYHLKAGGKNNWPKLDAVVQKIEKARKEGLAITADMYPYPAGATGLTASFPPSLQDGGFDKLRERLQDPAVRKQMAKAMNTDAKDWENLYIGAGGADHVLLLSFKQDSLKKYTGQTLAQVAQLRGKSPEETAMDLIVQDNTRVGVAYFMIDEANIRKQIPLPWLSFGSDEGSYTNQGIFIRSNAHPRAYGTFARVLGKYTREEKLMSLPMAIYKLSKLPAKNLHLPKRGELKTGNFADIVVFDPEKIADRATFEQPHQYAVGVSDVLVNGTLVLRNGEHTGAMPGRALRGPGYKKSSLTPVH